eukprot:6462612-Amphidinium_carterae.4
MHQRRKHGVQSALSLRTTSHVCPCCHANCGRRARVLDHYKNSRRRAAYTMEHVEPLSPGSFDVMMKLQRKIDQTFSREHIPKPGRKPAGGVERGCGIVPPFGPCNCYLFIYCGIGAA